METIICGSGNASIDEVGGQVDRLLGVALEPHESSYFGGGYLTVTTELDEEIKVVDNSVEDGDGEVTYPEFAGHAVIVEIEETERGDELVGKLAGAPDLYLLKRVTW
ncbi:hypothetical protein ABZ816_38000 [Actinosynnema sp. NPDC047251]|uniref:Uncharacterized protein n=1 Tax=Saccharothrix espanaensis (strain ATCC 51144 / DSM 44229 / JCM 9112 / NBRC 15066 / NRRL 15764) TaxID=1179773 RepID=K0JXZ9_SACES|nr:hypothetical protein [Saccharothrix espanaensis]CCH30202.1 hypothetical protein BN6_28930 [Saccharothrix espanaensis DSM 44229]